MKKTIEVFLKIFATYLFIKFLTYFFGGLTSFLTINDQAYRQAFTANSFINTGIYLLFSYLLWNNSEKIVNFYVDDKNERKEEFDILEQVDIEKLKEISFSIIGIIFFTLYFPRFIRKIVELFLFRSNQFEFGKQYIANFLSPLIESFLILIISLILIFGYKSIFLKVKKLFGNIDNS